MTPTITVCTDASFSPQHGCAAWAAYIRGENLLIKTGGVIKEPVLDGNIAERLALANALYLADKHADLTKLRLIVYTDNISAPRPIRPVVARRQRKNYPLNQKLLYSRHIKRLMDKAASVEIRHVKGHLSREEWTGTRNYMNNWADTEARRLLRAAIAEAKRINDEVDAEMFARIEREP